MFFHQKQEMNSSDFSRVHWSRHLCCKALVDRQAHVQPNSPSIYIEGTSSLITLSPSLVDPTLVSVVRAVDGQDTGLSAQPAEQLTSDRHRPGLSSSERTGPDFSAFKASADRPAQKRTQPLTSYPVSQSRVLLTNHEAGHMFSPTRKVGSAFFRTHVYCDYSPCFADPAWLSVVGFCGLLSCR